MNAFISVRFRMEAGGLYCTLLINRNVGGAKATTAWNKMSLHALGRPLLDPRVNIFSAFLTTPNIHPRGLSAPLPPFPGHIIVLFLIVHVHRY